MPPPRDPSGPQEGLPAAHAPMMQWVACVSRVSDSSRTSTSQSHTVCQCPRSEVTLAGATWRGPGWQCTSLQSASRGGGDGGRGAEPHNAPTGKGAAGGQRVGAAAGGTREPWQGDTVTTTAAVTVTSHAASHATPPARLTSIHAYRRPAGKSRHQQFQGFRMEHGLGYMSLAATTWVPIGAGVPILSPNDHPNPSHARQKVFRKNQFLNDFQVPLPKSKRTAMLAQHVGAFSQHVGAFTGPMAQATWA